jgi:cyclopropane fatty-acyl-phospholipid synthase-like methyltransferase
MGLFSGDKTEGKLAIMLAQKDKTYLPNSDPTLIKLVSIFFNGSESLLDLGCGSGANASEFTKVGFSVTGVTISSKEADVVKQICPVIIWDLESGMPPEITKNNYDVVVAAHLFEHIFYPANLLNSITKVVNKGVVIVIPNLLFWRNRLKMLFGNFEYTDIGIMDYTHSRWYTFNSIQKLLTDNGFTIKSATAVGGLYGMFDNSNWLKSKLNATITSIFPGLFGFQFYIVATKE